MRQPLRLVAPIVIIIAIIIGVVIAVSQKKQPEQPSVPTTVYSSHTTIPGDLTVASGTAAVVDNDAVLTVQGNLTVDGTLRCNGKPLNVAVQGSVTINGTVSCERPASLASGELGDAISVLATKGLTVGAKAQVIANGHVQFVSQLESFATSTDEVEKVFAEAAQPTGKPRIGPFTPLEQVPEGTPGRPQAVLPAWLKPFVATAKAQEPATDIRGEEVPDTVRIGGRWYVGEPGMAPPPGLSIPTPPPGIKKIIVLFDFGGDDVTFQDFFLSGPDARPGTDDVGKSCDAKGGQGENAMRMNVTGQNITINNFTLELGDGGKGGTAETTKDCDPATATGGEGGQAGNFKMVAAEGFAITGEFTIVSGKGGQGGAAIAHGKTGKDGCDGEKGGDATATGGKGGDNTKVLTANGVSGTDNITIRATIGGDGGPGTANGGNGGNGTGPDCNGGDGGKATATGGAGGNTTSNRFESRGGNGGDATAKPGQGGNGGQGSQTEDGGNGGKGGDASANGGAPGTGKTANGEDGKVLANTGGDGGNGGDGCQPGAKGLGGSGEPNGQDGVDGKNLCPGQATNTSVMPPANTNTSTTGEPTFQVNQTSFSFGHAIGSTPCPTPIGTVKITSANAPPGARYQIDPDDLAPDWLNYTLAGDVGDEGAKLSFSCQLDKYETQSLSYDLKINVVDANGNVLKTFTVNVTGTVVKP